MARDAHGFPRIRPRDFRHRAPDAVVHLPHGFAALRVEFFRPLAPDAEFVGALLLDFGPGFALPDADVDFGKLLLHVNLKAVITVNRLGGLVSPAEGTGIQRVDGNVAQAHAQQFKLNRAVPAHVAVRDALKPTRSIPLRFAVAYQNDFRHDFSSLDFRFRSQ